MMPALNVDDYAQAVLLPEDAARAQRFQAMEQAWVNALYEAGYALACPDLIVRFTDRSPQGIPLAGASPASPGKIFMNSDPSGRIPSTTGCAPPPLATENRPWKELVHHRWTALLHELGHFTFDQVPAVALTRPLEGLLDPRGVAGIREHVWAPFLDNLERRRLNETFADVWAGAVLLKTWGDEVRPGLDALRRTRQEAREASEQAWARGDVEASQTWVHLSDRALGRLLACPTPPPDHPEAFARWVIDHAVKGTWDRWQDQRAKATTDLEAAWTAPEQLFRLQAAVKHGHHHRDSALVDAWMQDHPTHPWMRLAHRMRGHAHAAMSDEHAWHQAWDTHGQAGLVDVLAQWHATAPHVTWAPAPPSPLAARRRRP